MENNNYIQREDNGIVCDSCDWGNNDVSFNELGEWLNKPCPKCGANLLTEDDYDNAKVLNNAFNYINSLSEDEIKELNEKLLLDPNIKENPLFKEMLSYGDDEVNLEFTTHGKIDMKIIKDDEEKITQIKKY